MAIPQPEPLYQPRGTGNRNRPMRPSGVWGKLKGVIGLLVVVGIFLYLLLPEDPRKLLWGPEPANDKEVAKRAEAPSEAPLIPPTKQTNRPTTNPTAKTSVATVEDITAAAQQRQEIAAAKIKQRAILAQGKKISTEIDKWLSELKSFQKITTELRSNEEGKTIAGNPTLLAQFVAISEQQRPTLDDAEEMRSSVEMLVEQIQLSAQEPLDASIPPETLAKQLSEFLEKAKSARDVYHKAQQQVEVILVQAKQDAKSGTVTLKDAMDEFRRQEVARRVAIVEAERRKAEEEATKKLAEEKARNIKMLAEAKQNYEREEATQRLNLEKTKKERMEKEAEHARLRLKAESPQNQARFQCFLADGTFAFYRDLSAMPVFTRRPGPVSYSVLRTNNWLNSAENFANALEGKLSRGSLNDWFYNDRPGRRGQPRTKAEWEQVQRDLELFKELAPIWVEMGRLAP